MVKTITKIGNKEGLIFDDALLDLAGLKSGDKVNIEVLEDGTLTLTPIREIIEPEAVSFAGKRLIGKNSDVFRRLS